MNLTPCTVKYSRACVNGYRSEQKIELVQVCDPSFTLLFEQLKPKLPINYPMCFLKCEIDVVDEFLHYVKVLAKVKKIAEGCDSLVEKIGENEKLAGLKKVIEKTRKEFLRYFCEFEAARLQDSDLVKSKHPGTSGVSSFDMHDLLASLEFPSDIRYFSTHRSRTFFAFCAFEKGRMQNVLEQLKNYPEENEYVSSFKKITCMTNLPGYKLSFNATPSSSGNGKKPKEREMKPLGPEVTLWKSDVTWRDSYQFEEGYTISEPRILICETFQVFMPKAQMPPQFERFFPWDSKKIEAYEQLVQQEKDEDLKTLLNKMAGKARQAMKDYSDMMSSSRTRDLESYNDLLEKGPKCFDTDDASDSSLFLFKQPPFQPREEKKGFFGIGAQKAVTEQDAMGKRKAYILKHAQLMCAISNARRIAIFQITALEERRIKKLTATLQSLQEKHPDLVDSICKIENIILEASTRRR